MKGITARSFPFLFLKLDIELGQYIITIQYINLVLSLNNAKMNYSNTAWIKVEVANMIYVEVRT